MRKKDQAGGAQTVTLPPTLADSIIYPVCLLTWKGWVDY